MNCNVGGLDRKLRIIIGIAIIATGIYAQSWLGVIGVILLLTGAIGWCPAYLPFGISTRSKACPSKDKSTAE